MDSETTISSGIQATDGNALYDAACKRLLSEKIILAWIMKQCLGEYKDCDVNEIAARYIEGQPQVGEIPVAPDMTGPVIHGVSGEDTSLNEGTVTFDICFYALAPVSGELIKLIINVEAQNVFHPGYSLLKRAVYYCSRLISSQYGKEFVSSHYDDIVKVYSIWICMNPPKSHQNSIAKFSLTQTDIVGTAKNPVEDYDLFSIIMVCLGGPDGEKYDGILKLLDVLLSSETSAKDKQQILHDDFDIKMTQSIEGGISEMCNLSKGIEEKGIAKGIAIGEKNGENAMLKSISGLMEYLNVPAEKAMTILQIPESEQKKYLSQLGQ